MGIRIRNARLDETKEIYKELLKPAKRKAYSEEIIRTMIKEKNSICLIAEHNKNIMGVIAGRSEGKKSLWLYIIAVKESFRKKGVGRLLMEGLFEKMRKKGCKRIATDTPDIKEAGFFKKSGFKIVGKLPKWYENKNQLIMFRKL